MIICADGLRKTSNLLFDALMLIDSVPDIVDCGAFFDELHKIADFLQPARTPPMAPKVGRFEEINIPTAEQLIASGLPPQFVEDGEAVLRSNLPEVLISEGARCVLTKLRSAALSEKQIQIVRDALIRVEVIGPLLKRFGVI